MKIRTVGGLVLAALACSCSVKIEAEEKSLPEVEAKSSSKVSYTATSQYKKMTVEGFKLLLASDIDQSSKEWKAALAEATRQLKHINKFVPDDKLKVLTSNPIWIEWLSKPGGAAEVHWGDGWLKANGHNPDKGSCVEISNVKNFTEWSKNGQPCMILHELAHFFHIKTYHTVNEKIKKAYDNAVEKGLYKEVKHVSGNLFRAYALSNHKEYFAELTEAYFGKNDFYPFNREELKQYDPVGYKMVVNVWLK